MTQPMPLDSMDTRISGDDFKDGSCGRIALENTADIFLKMLPDTDFFCHQDTPKPQNPADTKKIVLFACVLL